ncbi:MAG: long-chain fatty acid--CoA ligase [Bacteroidales bacterium]|nr:long-chain fatty acid--CoA ligase [Bacteroidales bacterium]
MEDISRIFDILTQYEEKFPNQKIALAAKKEGVWRGYSPTEYRQTSDNLSYAFIKLGVQPGDRVGIIATNRPEWNMLDMAIMQVGAITVPVYPTISENDYRHIVSHSGMKFVIVEGVEVMNKISSILPDAPELQQVYTFIDRGKFPYLAQLIQLGEENPAPEELQRRRDAVRPEDCSTLIYTSGTTGLPKGVMLSHYNIVSQLKNLRPTPSKWSCRALSFLPLCHAYERMLVFLYQHLGMSVYYAQNLGTIAENLKEVNPTMMSAVPRVLEKFYDKIWNSSKNMKPMKKKIFRWAVKLGEEYRIEACDRTIWYNLRHWVADKLVYSKIREKIGGNFDIIVSGAASIQPRLAAFFSAIGMPVYEGYGATEASPVIAVPSRVKFSREVGTVGFPLTGVEIRIADNGEILCRGHNVMMGYYKDEELTRTVIDKDGWFHTGDIGRWTERQQLQIVGRLKNIFKTSVGKYVNPQAIEEKFCESPFIENMVVLGENQKFAAALIAPDFEFLKGWCHRHDVTYTSPAEIINDATIYKRFAREVAKYNTFFGETEQVKRFALVSDEWSMKSGVLTPTLKIKRHIVQQRYKEQIDKLFGVRD